MENSTFSLLEKKLVITGASSGIDRQCDVTANQLEAYFIMLGCSEERLKEAA
jgi:NADP-dependent 3-hydroxy acid dehydrogenase YdfG